MPILGCPATGEKAMNESGAWDDGGVVLDEELSSSARAEALVLKAELRRKLSSLLAEPRTPEFFKRAFSKEELDDDRSTK